MALADVRNGEIKWGGVTLWGGMLEEIINRYSANSSVSGMMSSLTYGSKPIVQLALMEPKRLLPGTRAAVPESLLGLTSVEAVKAELARQMNIERGQIKQLLTQSEQGKLSAQQLSEMAKSASGSNHSIHSNPLAGRAETFANPDAVKPLDLIHQLQQGLETLDAKFSAETQYKKVPILDAMATGLVRLSTKMGLLAGQVGSTEKIFNADYLQDLIKMPRLVDSLSGLPTMNVRALKEKIANKRDISKKEIIELLQAASYTSQTGSAGFDMDRRLFQVADSYAHGFARADIDKVQAMRALVKDLLLHEVGHMLGLGHNFKENILPERGNLPDVSQKVGLYKQYSLEELKHAAHDQFKNYTTVMGYKDGVTDTLMKYEELHPGPGDILSLEYLYNARYPIYPVGAKGQGDFEFAKLAKDGWIVENFTQTVDGKNVDYRPAFFPACNDMTASFGMDPYCARWDRGYNASTLVKNYFENFRANLISSLNAFTDTVKGDAFWMQEMYLWIRSLNTFGRARVFHDYMRQKYDSDFRRLSDNGSEGGIQNLLQFSETCRKMAGESNGENRGDNKVENANLKKLFTQKPELMDLCLAGSQLVSELDQFMQLSGKDYTVLDYVNKYASISQFGGDVRANYGRMWGTWKELARTPIKISALMSLTSAYPFVSLGGWTVPITQYSREDGGYHISTLYAKEYTSAVASGAEMNLVLGNSSLDQSTTIGRTVLAMGYFLNNTFLSNDILKVGAPFIENIRSQTDFRYSYALIDVERENEESKPIARKFSGKIYNMYSRGPETVPELYVYTNDRTVVRPPPGSLLLALTPVRWYTKSSGYYYAIKLDFSDEFFDRLKTRSVRRTLSETYQEVIRKCIQGENRNGLRYFFNKDTSETVFPGFEFPDTIADRTDSKNRFLLSVEKEFEKYYGNRSKFLALAPERRFCEEAIRGQGLLVMAASVLNGYYFSSLYDYLEKDMSW
jgi:hypothetical protein